MRSAMSSPTAIADLVDNSISAGARNVWVDFHWSGADSVVTVTDDGSGMEEQVLVGAMRLGSKSPLAPREPKDLGRFGLGLKTASFSQCRCVTVRTRTLDGTSATRRWDLDHIVRCNQWQLLHGARSSAERHFDRLGVLGLGRLSSGKTSTASSRASVPTTTDYSNSSSRGPRRSASTSRWSSTG